MEDVPTCFSTPSNEIKNIYVLKCIKMVRTLVFFLLKMTRLLSVNASSPIQKFFNLSKMWQCHIMEYVHT